MRCDDCLFADWKRNSRGHLHPDKSGMCKRLKKHPLDMRLPQAFFWKMALGEAPVPSGGWIKRGRDFEKCIFKHGGSPP